VVALGCLFFFAMVSTRSSVSNANDTHTNNADAVIDADAAINANTNADDGNDANASEADAAEKAEDDPFPVLTCEERRRFIDIQWIIIRTLISEFWLERGVYYTTFNRPFKRVYKAALRDILELEDLIFEIIFDRKRRELNNSYVRIFPRGTFARIREHRLDIPEGPSSDEDKDYDNKDNRDNNGNGGKDSKSPDVNRKVGDKRPPDTDATLPLPTSKFARQADNLRAHLNVFPNGPQGPSGDRLLAEMELELLKRGTE
jgi:hypothetical protein